MKSGDYLKPVANGVALLDQQNVMFDRAGDLYAKIPVERMSTADQLTALSFVLGAGEATLLWRGAGTAAKWIGRASDGAGLASDYTRGTLGSEDFVETAAFYVAGEAAHDYGLGRGTQATIAAVDSVLGSRSALGMLGEQRINSNLTQMTPSQWAVYQGLNPLAVENAQPIPVAKKPKE
jgi:hypothetical protein